MELAGDGSRKEIAELLDKDLDEIYMLLAQSDPENAFVMFSPDQARIAGRALLDHLFEPLQLKICVEWDYCARRRDGGFSDSVDLAAAVADVIATVAVGLPVTMVAVALVKRGLGELCGCNGK